MLVIVPAAQPVAVVEALPVGAADQDGLVMGEVLPGEAVVAPVPMQMQTTMPEVMATPVVPVDRSSPIPNSPWGLPFA